jgi:hypothetical protein
MAVIFYLFVAIQVPRTFHNGIVGTFMNLDTHNKYFKDINYNLDVNVGWDITTGRRKLSSSILSSIGITGDKEADAKALVPLSDTQPNYLTAMNSVYEARMDALITHCTHLKTTHELSSATGMLPYLASHSRPFFFFSPLFFVS